MKIDFYRHALTAADAEHVAKVLSTPFLTTGAVCRQVEAQLAGYFSVPHAALANSWTNGALAVLLVMGIGPGDEVIVPANTFIATANVVELTGAKVIFADADRQVVGCFAPPAHRKAMDSDEVAGMGPAHLVPF